MIYYVEDDENIRNLVIYALTQHGFEAKGFLSSSQLYKACRQKLPDIILLDIMLPEEDGIMVLRTLRSQEETATIPIMMITAKTTEFDVITGLDNGADDYLCKPFGMMELVSRINALLRRTLRKPSSTNNTAGTAGENAGDVIVLERVELSISTHRVKVDGTIVNLTLKEFELLCFLISNPDLVFSRRHLLESIWGWNFEGNTRTVDVHIQTLRQKLGTSASLIETVRGVGYRARSVS